ncbi:MAG: DUF4440 domain-containing protein [Burkholderiaceae bacterium]
MRTSIACAEVAAYSTLGQADMRTTTFFPVLAVALGGCAAPGGTDRSAMFNEAEIRAAERALVQALQSSEPTAWVYSYTEDAVFVAPGAPAVEGRAGLLQMAKTMKPLSSVSIKPMRTEGSGNLATVYAHASWVSGQPSGAGAVTNVRLIIVWRKEADGQWRIAQELLHADPFTGR